jgi:hypothetical protein
MNYLKLFFFFFSGVYLASCSLSGGTLGAVAKISLDCDGLTVLNSIISEHSFDVPEQDSRNVKFWKIHGYDFLPYKCLKIKKNLFMITLDEDGPNSSEIHVRALYVRKNNDWKSACDFTDKEIEISETAMKVLNQTLSNCGN